MNKIISSSLSYCRINIYIYLSIFNLDIPNYLFISVLLPESSIIINEIYTEFINHSNLYINIRENEEL